MQTLGTDKHSVVHEKAQRRREEGKDQEQIRGLDLVTVQSRVYLSDMHGADREK